jgi:hypothetical protein
MAQGDWLTRMASERRSRCAAGTLGLAFLAALSIPNPVGARRKNKKRKSMRSGHNVSRCTRGTIPCARCGGLCLPPDVACSDDLCPGELCNAAKCGPGEYCCNESCSRCVPVGSAFTREHCPPNDPVPVPCGATTCGAGEYCCNPSCGICAPIGGGCAAISCEPPPTDGGELCGKVVCPKGTFCCNASCSMCAPPDAACIMIACVDEIAE